MSRSAWTVVCASVVLAMGSPACGPDRVEGFDAGHSDARADTARMDVLTPDVPPHDVLVVRDAVDAHDNGPVQDVTHSDTGTVPDGATCTTTTCTTADDCTLVCGPPPSSYMNCCYRGACIQYNGACPVAPADGGSGTCMMETCSNDDDCSGCSGGATCCLLFGGAGSGVCTIHAAGFCGGSTTDGGTTTDGSALMCDDLTNPVVCGVDTDCAGCGANYACFIGICFPGF